MNELSFPSGPWIGFYVYSRSRQQRHRMDLALTFAVGRITGDGIDDFGKFVISGRYDGQNGQCHWAKRYVGAHDVFYKGYREGRGIWGTWEITFTTGGFHIWPLSEGTGLHLVEGEKKSQPATVKPVLVPVKKTKILSPSAPRRYQVVQFKLERPCDDNQFGVGHASDLGFNFR